MSLQKNKQTKENKKKTSELQSKLKRGEREGIERERDRDRDRGNPV